MALGSAEHADRGRLRKSALLDVPPAARHEGVPRGRERGDVRHLRPGHEGEARVRRQGEERLEIRAADFLDDGRGWAAGVDAGVLVPRRREPIGGEGGGHGAADHPGEEPATGAPGEPTVDVGDEIVDDS